MNNSMEKYSGRKRIKSSQSDDNGADNSFPRPTVDDEFMSKLYAFVKKNRPRALTKEERLDILMLQAHLRYEHGNKLKKLNSGRPVAAPKVTRTVAQVLKRKEQLVGQIWRDYVRNDKVIVASVPGNAKARRYSIPDTHLVTWKIRQFILSRYETRTRTVAKDVLDFLVSIRLVDYDPTHQKSRAAGIRTVQRFLTRKGFVQGSRKTNRCYRLRQDIEEKRDAYVEGMIAESQMRSRRIVYIDESYIDKDYCRHEDSLYDPNDEQDLYASSQRGGIKNFFIAAIVDADHTIPEHQRTDSQRELFLHEVLEIFEGGRKQPSVCEHVFDHDYFESWMQKLVLALERHGINNALIVMDRAKHHIRLPDSIPKIDWKREKLLEACNDIGVSAPQTMLKSRIWKYLDEHIRNKVLTIVSTIARDAGHNVLYLPPYHSELSPMTGIWDVVKGEIGRQYSPNTTCSQFMQRIKDCFAKLRPHTVQGCINKANQNLANLYKHILSTEDFYHTHDDSLKNGDEDEDSCDDYISDEDDEAAMDRLED